MLQKAGAGLFPEVLGVRLTGAEPDCVRAEIDVEDRHCTVPGVMHGGAVMALADTLGGFATGLNLPAGAGTTTVESKTNFFARVRPGTTVKAECRPLHRGRSTQVWETRVTNAEGKLAALVIQTQIVLAAR